MTFPAHLFDCGAQAGINAAFERFHAHHPEVYDLFRGLAFKLLRSGHKRYSADGILHVIRFNYAVNPGKDGGGFKINNNFSSRYARLLVEENERFKSFFELRQLRTGSAA